MSRILVDSDHPLDNCNTYFKPPYGKYGGQIIDYCGVYSLSTNVDEVITCNSVVPSGGVTGHELVQTDATKAIADYCSKNQVMDPAQQPTPDQFTQAAQGDYTYQDEVNNGWIIRMSLKWDTAPTVPYSGAVPGAQSCGQAEKFTISGDECTRKLTNILNQCTWKLQKETIMLTLILGQGQDSGTLHEDAGYGCLTWSMHATNIANAR
jgi:hypothetical protein